MTPPKPAFIDFFAGSGRVTQGVRHACLPVGSNDICPKKAAMDTANHGTGHFHLGSIEQVQSHEIPCGIVL
jgi:DNA (cytosine-5)-methyltransferase 1